MLVPLTLGLLASLHCVAMCGPIAMALPVHQFNAAKKTVLILLYHLGRIFVYTLLGVFFGTLGKGLFLAGLQQKTSVILGVLLIISVFLFYIKGGTNGALNFNLAGYAKFKSLFGTYIQKRNPLSLFVLGVLNGLLPCAMVYMALFGATATQGGLYGGLFMFWYGLGTIPLLTVLIWLSSWVNKNFKNKLQKAIPVFLLLTGCLLIVRGLGLAIPYVSPSTLQLFITSNPQCS
ncbi:sulfite exporter TauE/SafE family protein [Myroides sp. JBRI-B21084]|uniref:sulfite exporter TauE/SafE family protein n=1 Tax=Myroides sp. JBRI-B21084 TaxID=3119977 RepID=UPI0026E1F14F|nr:sulfite exporter TauE/SafE family protein [Paenimyroides cloacae]WKW46656.1 sulfite exporter TauE/SafE family protein [Paenimyroides cloacae]